MFIFFIILLVLSHCYCNPSKRSFIVDYSNHTFMKDGAPFQYISGSIHYFRIPKPYWYDRLYKMKAAGLDAIQIYIPWNFHQPEQDIFDFDGDQDLKHFLQLASSLDLLVIARVGPYICAEWDFGGLPAWLLRINPLMKVRSSHPEYMKFVTKWFNVLLPCIKPYLYENGGPIIMVQLENEYGSYTPCDKIYLKELYNLARLHLGDKILIFTTDGPVLGMLKCGSSDVRYFTTIDFGPMIYFLFYSVKQLLLCLKYLKYWRILGQINRGLYDNTVYYYDYKLTSKYYSTSYPKVNSEYYVGWLDVWGGIHHVTSPEWVVNALNHLIQYSKRVNVNISLSSYFLLGRYMFHGGTNFGFWNGGARPESSITSYDYDAPISEAGDITRKYMLLRDLLFERKGIEPPELPKNITKISYGRVKMKLKSHLLKTEAPVTYSPSPLIMESLRQYNGYMIYSVPVKVPLNGSIFLEFFGISDIAHIFTGDQSGHYTFHGSLRYANKIFQSNNIHNIVNITIITENTGHINYGYGMYLDNKGITGPVMLNGKELRDWRMIPIKDPFTIGSTRKTDIVSLENMWPVPGRIYYGTFVIWMLADTFIHPDSFARGIISVNGHHIGRFDQTRGPQLRLYVPKTFLKLGENQITVVELQGFIKDNPNHVHVTFHDEMLWK
ncbi:Beta-galactosidase [Schistosoma japonicum]|nr:Beta-galactosidase [Schistosoma japonicum]KAH8865900.1 Beta-galactosidase [Schistosoma japonicum]KAH8865901.1 Beta-galactosidase [Schistosoma japonicum]